MNREKAVNTLVDANINLLKFYEMCLKTMRECGPILKQGFLDKTHIHYGKEQSSRSNIHTDMDICISDHIINSVLENYVSCGLSQELTIFSEENGLYNTYECIDGHLTQLGASTNWVETGLMLLIDPICGSIPFSRGVADFCTTCSLLVNSYLLFGVVYDPMCDNLFSAFKGKGAYLNGKSILPAESRGISRAYVSIEHKVFRECFSEHLHSLIQKIMRLRVAGTCGLEMAYVASGRLDGLIKKDQAAYDYLPGLAILLESSEHTKDNKAKVIDRNRIEINWDTKFDGSKLSFVCASKSIVKDLISVFSM